MSTLLQNLRFAARIMLNRPGFTLAAVTVLALGIGANSAMFSLVNALLLKPQAVQNVNELVGCFSRDAKKSDDYRAFAYPTYAELREKGTVFSHLAGHNMTMVGLEEGGITRRIFADTVSSNFFSTLGVRPARGREFTPEEERPGAAIPVVILSHSFQKKTSADLNQTVRLNGKLFTVIGILPEGFTGTTVLLSPSVYLPFGMYELVNNDFGTRRPLAAADNHTMFLLGRLKPGVSVDAANAQLAVIASHFGKAYAADKEQTFLVNPLSRLSVSTAPSNNGELGIVAALLLSMAVIILLIASLNVANMMLARGEARMKEIALRLALGAGRATILQQLLTEGALLALLGGAGGLVLAAWGTTALFRSMQRLLPLEIVYDTAPDPRVLAATLLFCALSTILFSLMPAWNLSRANVAHEIKGEKSSLFARRNLLVMAQLALSLVMLTAGGLFMRSAMRASNLDPGFRIDHSVLVDLDASLAGYDETRSRAAYAAVLDRLRAMPQVEAAGMAATTPFGMVSLGRDVRRTGSDAKQAPLNCRLNVVTADYFKAMGVPLVRGRAFTEAESAAGKAPPAVILDKPAAERLFPGADAVGQPVRLGGPDGRVAQVVGIVGEIQESIVGRKQRGHVFLPFGQEFQSMMSVHLKVTAEKPVLDAVRQEIRAVDPQLPVLGLASLRDHLDASFDIWMVRTAARMFSLFGGIALLLAAIGSYGVRAYVVERRTREIGIRMAIGASSADALRLVLREGLLLAGMGLGAGLLLSFAAGRALAGMLYQVSGADPLVFTVAPLLLATASLVACYIPARRAAHVDPMVALRYE